MNALIMTSKGVAMIAVDEPAPPRLEIYMPTFAGLSSDGETQLFEPQMVRTSFVLRGPGQDEWAIYEEKCKA